MKQTLMTHMVCGYPNLAESKKIFTVLSQYSKYIEVQFPFSDPIADGITISEANTVALKNNITTQKCFDFLEKHTKKSEAQVLIMTYYNIILNYWVETFIKEAKQKWIYGLIVPDILFDEPEGKVFLFLCNKYNIHLIQTISPSCDIKRLKDISKVASWFVYAVSQNMTTWNKWKFWEEFREYIKRVKQHIKIPLWIWFWITTKNDIKSVCREWSFAIIGSKMIKIYNEKGWDWINDFLK